MQDNVTLVIVHRNTPDWLKAGLRRFSAHGPAPPTVVVDNGSSAEARSEVALACRRFGARLLTLPDNIPLGTAIDAATKKVTTPWMLVLDSDTMPIIDGWLDRLMSNVADDVAVTGAPAAAPGGENPFGNFVHPSACLVNMAFLVHSGVSFEGAGPRWATGEQVTIEAMRLGWRVRYLPTTHFGVLGRGVIVDGMLFHARHGTRARSESEELAREGVDIKQLRCEHEQILQAERDFAAGGNDQFAPFLDGSQKPDISVVVPFRQHGDIGSANLELVVASLNAQTLDRNRYEIIIVEAAPAPSISLVPPRGCRAVYAHCADALFRKSWAMNVGFRHSSGDIIIFHDADVLAPETMLESIVTSIGPRTPAVKPSFAVRDIARQYTKRLHSRGLSALASVPLDGQRPRSAPGGSIAVTREQVLKMRGFNEGFVGWGGEDDEFIIRLRACGSDPVDLGCPIYHLWHEQESRDREQLAANRRLTSHVRGLDRRAVRKYVSAMPEGFGDIGAHRQAAPAKKRRQISALIVGAYSGLGPDANAGDDATRDVLRSALRRRGCRVRISPKHPCTEAHLAGVDIVIIGGGGLISDHSESAFYNYMSYLKFCADKSIPVVMIGVGVTRLNNKRQRISSLLRGASAVRLRSELSQSYLEDGGFASVTADLGWLLKPSNRLAADCEGAAGIFVVGDSYADNRRYRRSVHECVDRMVADGLRPMLVLQAKDDIRAMTGFMRKYKNCGILDYFASASNTPADMLAAVGRMSRVATSRYHGLVFAAIVGTPCEVIRDSPEKVQFLADEIGASRLTDRSELPQIVKEMRRRSRENMRVIDDILRRVKTGLPASDDRSVSVCMITLNDASYVRRALAAIPRDSLIGEILVVDGGSTDETLSVLKADGRVKILHRPFPHDFSNQKNFCISQAQHDWIVWLDSDEMFPAAFWESESLTEMMMSGSEAFWFPRENFLGSGPTPTNDINDDPDYQFRFFAKKCRWVGKVHENLVGYMGSPAKSKYVLCHRKSDKRQRWNNRYYSWMLGKSEHRPVFAQRMEG